jgi:hypothetical protein
VKEHDGDESQGQEEQDGRRIGHVQPIGRPFHEPLVNGEDDQGGAQEEPQERIFLAQPPAAHVEDHH